MKPGKWGTGPNGKPAVEWWRHGVAASGEPSIVTEVREYESDAERYDAVKTADSTQIKARAIYIRNGTEHRVQVDSESDGQVVFCAQGGGFVMRAPSAEFHAMHTIQKQEPIYVPALFGGDWSDKVFPGYTKEGSRWNGWGMPHFTKEVAELLKLDMPDLVYNAENDSFDINMDGELDQYEGGEIDVPGVGAVKVYAIGAGSWCWDSYKPGEDIGDLQIATEAIEPDSDLPRGG